MVKKGSLVWWIRRNAFAVVITSKFNPLYTIGEYSPSDLVEIITNDALATPAARASAAMICIISGTVIYARCTSRQLPMCWYGSRMVNGLSCVINFWNNELIVLCQYTLYWLWRRGPANSWIGRSWRHGAFQPWKNEPVKYKEINGLSTSPTLLYITVLYVYCKHNFVYAPSQWETTLQCNAVSHWLGAYTEYVAWYTAWLDIWDET